MMRHILRPICRLFLASALILGPCLPGPGLMASAEDTNTDSTATPAPVADASTNPATTSPAKLSFADKQEADRVNRLWKQFWKEYAGRCMVYDNKVTIFASYDPKYSNSRGAKIEELMNPPAGSDAIPMNQQEAEAYAVIIPQMAPGEYGYVMNGEVAKVLGPEDAILRKIQFVDESVVKSAYELEQLRIPADVERYQRDTWAKNHKLPVFAETKLIFQQHLDEKYKIRNDLIKDQNRLGFNELRVRGFDTSKMVVDSKWKGPAGKGFQIAVINTESFGDAYGDQSRLIAIPADRIRGTVTEDMFKKILADRGITIAKFVDMVMTERRKDPSNFKTQVMLDIKQAEMTEHPDATSN